LQRGLLDFIENGEMGPGLEGGVQEGRKDAWGTRLGPIRTSTAPERGKIFWPKPAFWGGQHGKRGQRTEKREGSRNKKKGVSKSGKLQGWKEKKINRRARKGDKKKGEKGSFTPRIKASILERGTFAKARVCAN